jgi:DUF4097 and DUF4098 domain-containing protein YvlB
MCGLVALSACDFDDWGDSHRRTEEFHHSYPMAMGGRLSVENFNGSVEVYGWDKNEVEINGTKYASTKDALDDIKVDIAARAGSIEIRTIRRNEPSRRGNRGARYRIQVPRRTHLARLQSSNGAVRVESVEGDSIVRTSNGPVRLMKVRGNADLGTSNGPVELSDYTGAAEITTTNGPVNVAGINGYLNVSTSNGPIHARIDKLQGDRGVRLKTSNSPIHLSLDSPGGDVIAHTSNGPVTVKLNPVSNVRVKASTSNSSVTSDFEFNNVMLKSKTRLDGTIGSGGPLLDLTTSNGPIRIQKN